MKRSDLSKKLNRYSQHIISEKPDVTTSSFNSSLKLLSKATEGKIKSNEYGNFLLLKNSLPMGSYYGDKKLHLSLKDKINHSFYSKDEIDGFSHVEDLLFFDIESTGLSGSGAVPFLIGFGSMKRDRFEVRQYFLPDFPDEQAMLYAVADEIKPDKTLVTYNGATFDLQLLQERFILNRIETDLIYYHHIDLLHTCRRLYKLRLQDCSLGNIEREILGFARVDDIPGYLVPSVYFEWISSQETDQLNEVLEHNKLDIYSLMFLIYEIKTIFESDGKSISDTNDAYSLSKIYKNRKQDEKVIKLITSRPESDLSPEMLYMQSLSYKRKKEWNNAVKIWNRLTLEHSDFGYKASIELAKYYEHKERMIEKALNSVKKAKSMNFNNSNEKMLLNHREKRLLRKLS